jgi:hypothetical protein
MNKLLVIAFSVIMLRDVMLSADMLSAAFCIVMPCLYTICHYAECYDTSLNVIQIEMFNFVCLHTIRNNDSKLIVVMAPKLLFSTAFS